MKRIESSDARPKESGSHDRRSTVQSSRISAIVSNKMRRVELPKNKIEIDNRDNQQGISDQVVHQFEQQEHRWNVSVPISKYPDIHWSDQ